MAKKLKKRVFVFGALLFSIFAAQHLLFFAPSYYEFVSSCIVYPILIAQNRCIKPLKNYFAQKRNAAQLQEQLDSLMQEVEDADGEIVRLKAELAYMKENAELHEFRQRYNQETMILGQIIFKEQSDQEHAILINKGEKDGIKKDMVAVYKESIVGRVSEVFPWFSKIMLTTDRSCKIAAYAERSGATGIHEGINKQGRAQLNHVSHLSPNA